MKQSLPTVLVLAVICASAALALAQTMRDKAILSSHNEIVRPTSQRSGPMERSERSVSAANIAKLPELLHKAYLAGQRE